MTWHLHDLIYFAIMTVGVRFLVFGLFSSLFFSWLQKHLVKTERDAILWVHYHKHAMKRGHSPRHVLDCQDEDCRRIT